MGKITLDQAAKILATRINTNTDIVREKTYNKEAHILSVDKDFIIEQIKESIGISIYDSSQYSSNRSLIEKEVETYCKAVFNKANEAKNTFIRSAPTSKRGFAVELLSLNRISSTSNQYKFRILIISISGGGSAFNKAKSLKREAEATLVNKISKIAGIDIKFDIGHTEAVSRLQAEDAASEFFKTIKSQQNNISVPASIRKLFSYKTLSKLSVSADKRRKGSSKYLLSIEQTFSGTRLAEVIKSLGNDSLLIAAVLEDSEINQAKGRTQEARQKNKIKKAVEEVATKIDWANTSSSLTDIEQIKAEILFDASRAIKGRVKGSRLKNPTNRGRSKAQDNIIEEINNLTLNVASSSYSSTDISKIKPRRQAPEPQQNWLRLLPIINQRLTPKVIANMRFPSLVNRTGTFANSAKVVNVEQTREGFPTFVFDYERDPYNVFDRSVGRSPWNTPERDPRALVDKSVREIVREMAIGRFYTRRA